MITVVGIGCGSYENMTAEAVNALKSADHIVGYELYVKLVENIIEGKPVFTSGMRQERERCLKAVELAVSGKNVALVSGGDPGVYGMAALVMELAEGKGIDIKVVSGVSACLGGAAVLGSPLTGDFAVISLSDWLTPMEKIEKRLECAAMADFVICIYNPSSRARKGYLKKACDIILKHISPGTPCGYAENIGREGQNYCICTLEELREKEVNMFTIVFIGNSATKIIDGRLVTSRGYKKL